MKDAFCLALVQCAVETGSSINPHSLHQQQLHGGSGSQQPWREKGGGSEDCSSCGGALLCARCLCIYTRL